MSTLPCLRAALHWRCAAPFAPHLDDWELRAALAGRLAGEQLAEAVKCSAGGSAPDAVFMVSTILDSSLTAFASATTRFEHAFARHAGQPLQGIVNAYLCAGWGFVLRHAMRNTVLRRIAICIVDLDLHHLQWQLEHPVIGRAGFGVSTLLFALPLSPARLPEAAGPYPNSAFPQFVMALRGHRGRHGVIPTFIPFVQDGLYETARRVTGGELLAPNRYGRWGHCFGADPWIGLIEACASGRTLPGRILAGAFGYNGYYALTDLELDAGLVTQWRQLDGADIQQQRRPE